MAFQEWTEEGIMRQPIFLGLREDITAPMVHREVPKRPPKSRASAHHGAVTRGDGNGKKPLQAAKQAKRKPLAEGKGYKIAAAKRSKASSSLPPGRTAGSIPGAG